MVDETVKHVKKRSTSIIAYGAGENLRGVVCSIWALHTTKKFLLAPSTENAS